MLAQTIPSYAYWQYQNDSDISALIRSYNDFTQEFIDWFNSIGLPIYTGLSTSENIPISGISNTNPGVVSTFPIANNFVANQYVQFAGINGMTELNTSTYPATPIDEYSFSIGVNTTSYTAWISGGTVTPVNTPLLDWVGNGLYGFSRPVVSSGYVNETGFLGTFEFNTTMWDYSLITSGAQAYSAANDDMYQRCMTWRFFKRDGFYFSIPWLKRRIVRFLIGPHGIDPLVGMGGLQLHNLSISVSNSNAVTINYSTHTPLDPVTNFLQIAINGDSGIFDLPFGFTYQFNIIPI